MALPQVHLLLLIELALGLGLVLLVVVLGLHALVALLRQASQRWAGPSAAWERLA